ncbi:MAG: heavy metal translocating P-type ATPase, partial [Dehalococcoidia bacterium]|nr:heavy metal translocating P-type ATPase [Dehalococcoidia bacterium]
MSDVSVKKEYSLPNLGCANCAAKMEDEIRKLDGVIDISVVFISKTLTMELAADKADTIVEQARIIINEIEPGVVAIDVLENPEGLFVKKGNHDINNNFIRNKVIRLGLSGVFFGAAITLGHFNISPYITIPLYIISYLLSGGGILLSAGRNILKGRIFDENFLMSVATLGAFAIGYFDEGVAVMLFFQVGMLLQNLAAGRSRRSIAALMDIRPDTANLVINDGIKVVSPTSVKIGEAILIRPGEKVPLDGIVVEGTSMVDTSALTGESVPREVLPGNDVLAGFINRNGALTVLVSKEFGQSTVAKILNMMQNASAKKAPTENFITSFARYYTPVVTMIALIIALIPPLLFNQPFADWIYRALVFLVVSCPCALVLSIPLGFFGGIGAASRVGVLVKGSNYLEALVKINTMVFDKTGTLTKGVFEVTKIQPHGDYNNTELLQIAAHAEAHSNHPIAVSIRKAYGNNLNTSKISGF